MNLKNNHFILVGILSFAFLFSNCKRSEYTELVRSELKKKVVYDSLIFGLKLGDKKQHFFDVCWQLNKDKKVKQGPMNNFVQYRLPAQNREDVNNRITMLFYGIFNSDKIMTGFDMKFYYDAWSLWNESLHSDKLVLVVKDSLNKWYPGNDFIPVTLKKSSKEILVKVDGNRQIVIEPLTNNREVDVRIEDLRYIKGIN